MMGLRLTPWLCAGLLVAATAPLHAQEAPQGPVERVTVSGRAEATAPLDPTAFATVIRAEDFADRLTSVEELMRESVGVSVQSLGGAFATVSVRGSTAEQVMVYLDGIPLNHALGGAVNLADLPLAQVESIEIYRGFTPASLPAASIGGAILIHTRRAARRPAASASLSYGSFRTAESAAGFSGTYGRSEVSIGVDTFSSRGDFPYLTDLGTGSESRDDFRTPRRNNDVRRDHLTGRSTVRLGERAHLSFTTDFLKSDEGVAGVGSTLSSTSRYATERLLLRSELEAPGFWDGRLLLKGAADYGAYTETFDDPDGTVGLGLGTHNRIASLGQELGLVFVADAHQALSLLTSHRSETADLVRKGTEPSGLGTAGRDTLVATIEDQISLAGGRLLLNPSLRAERYDNHFELGPAGGIVPGSLVAGESRTTGKVGFRIRAGAAVTVRGNAGTFLRLPDFNELFGNRGAVRGNPALRPESGRNADLGIIFIRPRLGTHPGPSRLELTLFETNADDLILFVPTPEGTVLATNVGGARIRGMEMTCEIGLGRRFGGSLNATRQWTRDLSDWFSRGKPLPGRPRDELSAGAHLDLGLGRFTYTFTYVGPNFTNLRATADQALAARYLHDIGYRRRLSHGLQTILEVKNIGDSHTYDVARFPLPGRSLEGRLTWAF